MCETYNIDDYRVSRDEIETLMDREDAKERLREQLYKDVDVMLDATVYAAEKANLQVVGQAFLEHDSYMLINEMSQYVTEYIENHVNQQFGE